MSLCWGMGISSKTSSDGHAAMPSLAELVAAEAWLWARVGDTAKADSRRASLRAWLIFVLLRHAGLRLAEIGQLTASSVDLAEGCVHVAGRNPRTVPLHGDVQRRLGMANARFAFLPALEGLLCCDASFVRRSLNCCAKACSLPKGLLNARNLRNFRAVELLGQGVPQPVVEHFLGRQDSQAFMRASPAEAEQALFEHIRHHHPLPTSARNVFQGRITELRRDGLVVHLALATVGGLGIRAVITASSAQRLALSVGGLVNASVKAFWVRIGRSEAENGENCHPATVDAVQDDGKVCEIVASLPDGSQICAIQPAPAAGGEAFAKGDRAVVRFAPSAIIVSSTA